MDWPDEEDVWDDDTPSSLKNTPEGMWKQRDGTFIAIKKMTDTHLNNAINMCKRKDMEWFADDLKVEWERREQIRVRADAERFPEMKAFIAGWNAGYRASDRQSNPGIGPGNIKINMLDEWAAFKQKRDRERLLKK